MGKDELDEILAGLERYSIAGLTAQEVFIINSDLGEAKKAIQAYADRKVQEVETRAGHLNDGLRRAAEFMHENKLLPPDTTTIDGIRSYFLNEARFKEAKK